MEKIKELWSNPKARWAIIGGAAGLIALIVLIVVLANGGAKLENATVTILSEIEAPMADVGIYVYSDESQADMITFVKTDENGVAKIDKTIPEGAVIVLSGIPKGYAVAKSYTLTQVDTKIILEISLLQERTTVGVGDIMFDFTVTDTDGKEHTLSKLLEEKDAVVLNFWFAGCDPCKMEFPSLAKAYETHGQDIALLAMNPTDETLETITAFKSEFGLNFPVVKCDATWAQQYYPTTIVIDRFGMVSMIHVGSVVAEGVFEGLFSLMSAEDYKHTVIDDIMSLKIDVEASTEPTVDPESGLLEISGAEGFEVTVAPGQKVECDVYKVSGMMLKVESADATVTYKETEYKPENGVIEVEVLAEDASKPIHVSIGNTAQEEKTFQVTFYHREGSAGKPVEAALGTLNVELTEGNVQGMYYTYKAEEAGTFVVECNKAPSVKYDYALVNLRTNKKVTYSEDGKIPEETKLPTLELEVTAGDKVQLIVTTVEDSHPAAKLSFMSYTVPAGGEATEPTEPAPQAPDTAKYTRIDKEELLVTGKYVIVADKEYAMDTVSGTVVKPAEPKIDEHTVTDSKHAVWELVKSGKKLQIKNAEGKYLAPKGGNNNGVMLSASPYNWDFELAYGAVKFMGAGQDTVTLASYEPDDYEFSAYKNELVTGEDAADYFCRFYLYRLDDGSFKSKLEGTEQGKVSNPDAPVEIGSTLSFTTVDIGLGEQVNYHIYRVGGTTLSIKSKDAYVVYNKKTYTPNSSGYIYISMPQEDPAIPVILAIGNSGVELERFKVNFYYPAGSRENPHDYTLGETVTTDIKAGNDQGIFYSFKASATGTLTLEFVDLPEGAVYGITLTTQGTIPVQQSVVSTEGTSVSIQVEAGVKVEIVVSTLPVNGRYPKASIKTIGKFE